MQLGDVGRKALRSFPAQLMFPSSLAPSPKALSDFRRIALVSSWIPSLVWAPRGATFVPVHRSDDGHDIMQAMLRSSSAHGQALFFNCNLALLKNNHPPLQTHQLVNCVQVIISNRNKILVSPPKSLNTCLATPAWGLPQTGEIPKSHAQCFISPGKKSK